MTKTVVHTLLFLGALALWGRGASAQKSKVDTAPQYRLLATSRTSTLEKEIREAAASGYRVALGCKPWGYGEWLVLMERVAGAPEPCDYKLLATELTSTMQRELEAAAAQGYRVLPRAMIGGGDEIVIVLEKAPSGGPDFQYQLLATTLTSTLQNELAQASTLPSSVVGLFSRDEHMALIERPRQPAATPGAASPGAAYLLLATTRTSTMQREFDDAISRGYRILASSPTSGTEIMTLLENAGQPCAGCKNKLVAANRLATMEKELNAAAADGFRLLWRTAVWKTGATTTEVEVSGTGVPGVFTVPGFVPDEIVGVMQKSRETQGRYRYRVQGAIIPSSIERKITRAAREGYRVAALLGRPNPGKSSWPVWGHMVVVLERSSHQ